MTLGDIKDYQRLFRHRGFRFLLNNFWAEAYKGHNAIALAKLNDYTSYMPKASVRKTLNEGLELFKDKKAFDEHFGNFSKFQKKTTRFFKKLLESEISKEDAEKIIELYMENLRRYSKTEFIYTDKAYLEAQKPDDPVLKQNVKKFNNIKNKSREFINEVFMGRYSYAHQIFKKISKKHKLKVRALLQYSPEEFLNLFDGHKIPDEIVKMRKRANIVLDEDGVLRAYWGEEAEDMINEFLKKPNLKKELSGTIANRGKVQGKVKILKPGYDDFHEVENMIKQMEDGDILVSETTSPELFSACKKAAAIVTDQGGLLSHAAIVSRELKIPCIVGTGNATEILKDGDEVEVDATKGIVKILK